MKTIVPALRRAVVLYAQALAGPRLGRAFPSRTRENKMPQTVTVATTALITAIVASWGTTVIIAQSSKKPDVATASRSIDVNRGRAVAAEDHETDQASLTSKAEPSFMDWSWRRWPSPTDF